MGDGMDEKQLESQSRLLIELGEPEAWLETMLRASRRSASHEASQGNEELASRWRRLTRGLEHAIAATVDDPLAGTASTSMARQHVNPPAGQQAHTAAQPIAKPNDSAAQAPTGAAA